MVPHSVTRLADAALLGRIRELVHRGNGITAELLVHLAEAEERKLYVPAGYTSLMAWCVEELHLSEDAACDRIDAARVARRHPAIVAAVAEGRLHLSGVLMLARHLTAGNADDLIRAATHLSKAKLAVMLAHRFPRPDVPTVIRPIANEPVAQSVAAPAGPALSLAEASIPGTGAPAGTLSVPERIPAPSVPERMEPRPRIIPLAPERYEARFTMPGSLRDKLAKFAALAAHRVRSGDIAAQLEYALDLAIAELEKRKFAATDRPRAARPGTKPRTIPRAVKRQVWKRDDGRCTFTSDAGHRCACRRVEYDHVIPVARGGAATVDNLRLRCRAHNQYAAEQAFGAGFMERKRRSGRARTASPPAPAAPGFATPSADEARRLAIAAAREAEREMAKLWGPAGP